MRIGFDSDLLRDVYLSPSMAELFAARRQLQAWLDVEAALARAQARLGLVPTTAAEEISRRAVADELDLDAYRAGLREALHPIVPMVRLLTAACEGDAGQYVHWGATTQDIMDTAMVLQLREANQLIARELTRCREASARLAARHRDDVMPGRTHGQHAVPITFGYKAAVWLDELDRHRVALERAAEDLRVVQFGGAAGTLASLGPDGLDVRRELAAELDLAEPRITWHVARDRLVALGGVQAGIALFLQRLSREVALLQGTEMAEVAEPFHHGKVGSSTMPHKRNPVLCETVFSLSVLVQDAYRTLMTASVQQHERDMATWQLEWDAVPRLWVYQHRALGLAADVLEGLHVDRDRMRANVELTDGLIMSESTMMRLAPSIGRQEAHDVVYDAAMAAFEERRPLADVVAADPRLAALEDARSLAQPESVVDAAGRLVDDVLAAGDQEPK